MLPNIVTLGEAKLFCRVDNDYEDDIILVMIDAATEAAIDVIGITDWDDETEFPARVKLAVLTHVAAAYDLRFEGQVDTPPAAARLLGPLRRLDI